jgi:hypothetical protein
MSALKKDKNTKRIIAQTALRLFTIVLCINSEVALINNSFEPNRNKI